MSTINRISTIYRKHTFSKTYRKCIEISIILRKWYEFNAYVPIFMQQS